MSISIYYTARRPRPITEEEAALCRRIADRWQLDCLEEITNILPGAQWRVHLDDLDLEWTEQKRFRFPA